MDKYNDSQFSHAFSHAQMMQTELRRKRFSEVDLEQTSREIEFDQKLFAAKEKINRERELKKQFDAEVAETNNALLNILMQTLGLIAVVTIAYWAFIQFTGA